MSKIKLYTIILAYWIAIVDMVAYFGLSSIRGFVEVSGININSLQSPLISYWVSPFQIYESTLFGIFFGVLFIAVNELSDRLEIQRLSFGRVILIKSSIYLTGFIVSLGLVYFIMSQFSFFPKAELEQLQAERSVFILIILAFFFVCFQIVLINFMLQTVIKFGTNNLFNILSGKYRTPVIESRVFLFMDLKSSTTYAERLGSIKYSNMIKDCIDEINRIVDDYHADIYQYVGDEIVLTWKKETLSDSSCLNIYFAFHNNLKKKSNYYQEKYGMVPEFKAGIHGGDVTVAEIGNVKRDIAYYGDVLNTASRLQSICNDYGEHMLISRTLLNQLSSNSYEYGNLGKLQLKGKVEAVDVVSVRER